MTRFRPLFPARWPLVFLPLFACHSGDKGDIHDTSPGHDSVADSVPPETGAHDSHDSHDTQDTHDSHGETADSGSRDSDSGPRDTGGAPLPCFADILSPVDYTSSGATLNATCTGTNHQDISGIERVVFVGDSVTAGAPIPVDWSSWELTDASEWYRNVLADELVARWGLEAPDWFWQNVDLTSGESWTKESGDFANCSKWGARADDLHSDNTQLDDCLPEASRGEHNLVIMTIGGNDLYNLLDHVKNQDVDEATMRTEWDSALSDLSDAMHWLKDDPTMFPGGIDVIVADLFDVTDATSAADIADCPGAQAVGLDVPLVDPLTAELTIQWQEAVLQVAVETDIDVAFMGETFCGHGYNWDDATGRCYRGGDSDVYFDASCEHPTQYGHAAIANTMLGVIDE